MCAGMPISSLNTVSELGNMLATKAITRRVLYIARWGSPTSLYASVTGV